MKWFAMSSLAVLAGVAALAGIGPAGSASAVEKTAIGPRTANVAFHVTTGVSLGKPTTLASTEGVTSESRVDVGERGAGFRLTWTKHRDRVIHTESWPILEGPDAKSTSYKVIAGLDFSLFSTEKRCQVIDQAGVEAGPFHCSMIQRGWDYDWDMYIVDDRVDRDLEVSASVRTVGSVSLEGGFFTLRPHSKGVHVAGATSVPTNASTQLNSVARPDPESRDGKREASAYFEYELFDNGKPVMGSIVDQPITVSGFVSNIIGWEGERTNNSWCTFFIQDFGYSCTVTAYYAKTGVDDRTHYVAEITVRKK